MENLLYSQLRLSIDLKKNRIRIHKQTLRFLEDPPYIQLLFSPRRQAIVVLRRDRKVPNGQEIPVVFDKPDPSGTFDIYSKELIHRIRGQFPGLDRAGLYRLSGFGIPEDGGVLFPLSTLSRAEDAHV